MLAVVATVASTSVAGADPATVVAVIPLATSNDLAIYGKPVADALATRLKDSGVAVESLSLSGAIPARVGLVIDGRIVEAGPGRIKLEARVRDPGRGIAIGQVATEPRLLTEIDEAAAELAKLLAPKLAAAIAERKRLAAAEQRHDPQVRAVKPTTRIDRSAAPRPWVDGRPVMVVVDATGSADGIPAHGIVTRASYWLAERLGFRPVPATGALAQAIAAAQSPVGYGLALELRSVDFTWHGSVLSARGRVRVVLVDAQARVLFDRTVRTGTLVGSRGDRQDALVHHVAIQAVDIVTPHLKRALAQ